MLNVIFQRSTSHDALFNIEEALEQQLQLLICCSAYVEPCIIRFTVICTGCLNQHVWGGAGKGLPILTVSASICNGNRTEWSPIRFVIIPVMTKCYREYDYRPN